MCELANTTKLHFVNMIEEVPKETPLRRMAQFDDFLTRVEIHIRTVVRLFAQLKDDGQGWISHCKNLDKQKRSLDDETLLNGYIRKILVEKEWAGALWPDIRTMARKIKANGGVCKLRELSVFKDPDALYAVLDQARSGVAALYQKLGVEETKGGHGPSAVAPHEGVVVPVAPSSDSNSKTQGQVDQSHPEL
jgi:hypothetical protein